jgi:hypothetical protein
LGFFTSWRSGSCPIAWRCDQRGGGWGWCWNYWFLSLRVLRAWRFSFGDWMVFLGHLPHRNRVQAPKTKSRSNACSWEICYACGGRGEGKYLMKWAGFGSLVIFAATCVGVKGGSCNCGGRWTSSSLWLPSLPGRTALSILPGSGRRADPRKATKTVGVLLPWSGFFKGKLSGEGMHVPDRVSRSFCTCGPTDRLVRVLPSELIGGEGIRGSSSLGFNSLFLNQLLL